MGIIVRAVGIIVQAMRTLVQTVGKLVETITELIESLSVLINLSPCSTYFAKIQRLFTCLFGKKKEGSSGI